MEEKMDKNLARIKMIEAIEEFLDGEKICDRDWYIGEKTIELMAESALSVLFSIEDIQDYLKKEDLMK